MSPGEKQQLELRKRRKNNKGGWDDKEGRKAGVCGALKTRNSVLRVREMSTNIKCC